MEVPLEQEEQVDKESGYLNARMFQGETKVGNEYASYVPIYLYSETQRYAVHSKGLHLPGTNTKLEDRKCQTYS